MKYSPLTCLILPMVLCFGCTETKEVPPSTFTPPQITPDASIEIEKTPDTGMAASIQNAPPTPLSEQVNTSPSSPNTPGPSTPVPLTTPTPSIPPPLSLQTLEPFGDVYYDLTGSKGLVLCFHGTGGSANGWSSGEKFNTINNLHLAGYAVLCPTSKNRSSKQWDLTDAPTNPDIENVDALLNHFKVPTTHKIFIIGHSNGGGFTARFANNTQRKSMISAIQVSNHPGSSSIYSSSSYIFPTLFNYADCDPIINAANVRNSINVLRQRGILILENDLDSTYASGNYSDCHEFIDTAATTRSFFEGL